MSNSPIQIIGAGVSGLTTGLTLQLLGYDTVCYTAHEPTLEPEENDPAFASRYPAASILPHSVFTDRLKPLFTESQQIFKMLESHPETGLRRNRHHELFEFEVADPPYAGLLDAYETLEDVTPSDRDLPHREGAESLFGRSFECLFAEWQVYYPLLLEWYRETGGRIKQQRLDTDKIRDLPGEVVVNCSGQWAPELVLDPVSSSIIIGVLVNVDVPESRMPNDENRVSYNYTPGKEHYAHSEGDPVDIYCYPREHGWVLGGTRLKGWFDKNGQWMGETQEGPSRKINDIEVPDPVIELNAELIQQLYGFDVREYDMEASFGYRFTRDSGKNGLRLDTQEASGKLFVHNYGHGGAGVSLSWGCALEVSGIIRKHKHPSKSNEIRSLNQPLPDLKQALTAACS